MRLISSLTLVVFAAGVVTGGFQLFQVFSSARAKYEIAESLAPGDLGARSHSVRAPGEMRRETLPPDNTQQDPAIYRARAKQLFRAARQVLTVEERSDLLCQSLLSIEQSLQLEPEDPMTLVAWVEVASVLVRNDRTLPDGDRGEDIGVCGASRGDSDRFIRTLEYVSSLAPRRPQVQFHVGRLASLQGEEALTERAFRTFLETSPSSPSEIFAEVIERWSLAHHRLAEVLPSQMPHVLYWSRRLKGRFENPLYHESSRYSSRFIAQEAPYVLEVLREKQREAVNHRIEDLQEKDFPVALFVEELLKLIERSADDRVRREMDIVIWRVVKEHSRSRQGASSLSHRGALLSDEEMEFLALRAQLSQLPGTYGWNGYDRQPRTGALTSWGSPERLPFDTRFRSVGLVVPYGKHVELFTLATESALSTDFLTRIKLYFSEDNVQWFELNPSKVSSQVITLGDQTLVAFQLKEQQMARLWKVHFASKSGTGKISGAAKDIFSLYGKEG
jgi:hypothetical protein